MAALNDVQLEILRLFHPDQSAEELEEIRSFEQWRSDHFRKPSRQ